MQHDMSAALHDPSRTSTPFQRLLTLCRRMRTHCRHQGCRRLHCTSCGRKGRISMSCCCAEVSLDMYCWAAACPAAAIDHMQLSNPQLCQAWPLGGRAPGTLPMCFSQHGPESRTCMHKNGLQPLCTPTARHFPPSCSCRFPKEKPRSSCHGISSLQMVGLHLLVTHKQAPIKPAALP